MIANALIYKTSSKYKALQKNNLFPPPKHEKHFQRKNQKPCLRHQATNFKKSPDTQQILKLGTLVLYQ